MVLVGLLAVTAVVAGGGDGGQGYTWLDPEFAPSVLEPGRFAAAYTQIDHYLYVYGGLSERTAIAGVAGPFFPGSKTVPVCTLEVLDLKQRAWTSLAAFNGETLDCVSRLEGETGGEPTHDPRWFASMDYHSGLHELYVYGGNMMNKVNGGVAPAAHTFAYTPAGTTYDCRGPPPPSPAVPEPRSPAAVSFRSILPADR